MTTIEDGRLGRVEGILEEIRSRLNSLEIRVNAQQVARFNLLLGATIAVMITMWVTTVLVIVLRV